MYNRQIEKLCRTRLDDVLLDEGLTDRSQVEAAQAESEVTGTLLSQVLFDRELLDEWDLAKLVARHYSLPYINPEEYSVPEEAQTLLPADFCRAHGLVPIDVFGASVAIAVCEMPSVEVLKELETRLGTTPFIYVALRAAIHRVIDETPEDAYVARDVVAVPDAGAVAPDAAVAAMVAGIAELPGIAMRLGYSMHARSTQHTMPIQPLRALASRPAQPVDGPAVAAAPAVATESGDAGKSPAAWQEIFDLGNDATS